MKVVLRMDGRVESGGSPLLMHNERLADPLDDFARALKEISGKRGKTDADLIEMGRREFLGGLYTNGNGPCIPAWNIIRCLQGGAARHRRGKDVLRGCFPLLQEVDVLYEGPRDPDALWKLRESFSLRKGVGVGQKKVMRTRPIFSEWAAELPIEIDPEIFNLDAIATVWRDAGRFEGLGDMRPVYGRFVATALSDESWLKQENGDADSIWRANRSSVERVIRGDAERKTSHRTSKAK